MREFAFPRKYRLHLQRDFDRIFTRRISVADPRIIVYGCENGLDYSRLGISVPRKVGKSVRRNRWRRLIREAFRLQRKRLPKGIDFVVVARSSEPPHLNQLQESLLELAWRVSRKLQRCPPPAGLRPFGDGSGLSDGDASGSSRPF
jgi:ribonuclease P protein component